jgi:hypothetical protein
MEKPYAKEVDERRAAVLTGLSSTEIRSLAREAALGHNAEEGQQMLFTFEELQQLCVLARNAHL